jgi:putative tryptophan/tyrosine transport system substrate-binding protein
MNCCTIGLIFTLAMVLAPLASDAQQPAKVPVIGELMSGSPPSEARRQPGLFGQALRELGWIEGQNIALERRYAEEQLDRLADLAAELVRLKPDVIVVSGTRDVLAAKQATTTIPIVIIGAGMLVEQGIVASLAQPGGNITGVENQAVGFSGKRLELLKAALPQIARVAFLFNPTNPFVTLDLPSLETAARALGLQLQPVAVRHADEFDSAFATIIEHRPDALFLDADGLLTRHLRQIMDFATTHQLPTMGLGGKRLRLGPLRPLATTVVRSRSVRPSMWTRS